MQKHLAEPWDGLDAGLALPLVVPPIRDALGYGRPQPVNPPPVKEVRAADLGC